ncbi:carboxymuconolactone decarboxylase family protein [Paraburkholderia lycopersici]|uniref:carboxymuconolactone decarboxylase family protein n=1 Tax=Paraburkholderia lycopersici TaxID=416944 RepID=UPI000B8927AF|nr:carboxymuconolactone decarboxylase family protein [Paraburkholderia lycopersici]
MTCAYTYTSPTSRRRIEAIELAASDVAGCDYCLAAHTLAGKFADLAPETMKAVRAAEPGGFHGRAVTLRALSTSRAPARSQTR